MTTALPALETQRSEIQRKIGQLGDMRSGSITTTPAVIAEKRAIRDTARSTGLRGRSRVRLLPRPSPRLSLCAKRSRKWRSFTAFGS